jgi:hypothetical protein
MVAIAIPSETPAFIAIIFRLQRDTFRTLLPFWSLQKLPIIQLIFHLLPLWIAKNKSIQKVSRGIPQIFIEKS